MSEQHENLSPRQRRAVLSLLEHGTVESAAEDVKVSARTLRRWLKQPAFRREYIDAGEALYERGLGQLQQLASFAVARLGQILVNNSMTSTGQMLRACEIILANGRSASQHEIGCQAEGGRPVRSTLGARVGRID